MLIYYIITVTCTLGPFKGLNYTYNSTAPLSMTSTSGYYSEYKVPIRNQLIILRTDECDSKNKKVEVEVVK